MKSPSFVARWQTIALLVIAAAVLAGCAGTRQGISWPALSTIEIDGETKILVAYTNRVDVLEPSNRALVWSLNGDDLGEGVERMQFFANPNLLDENGEQSLLFPTYSNALIEIAIDQPQLIGLPIGINGAALAEAVVTDDFFYVPYRTSNLVAIERNSFDVAWTLTTDEGVWAQPLLVGDVLYVASLDHKLYAVDAVTGEPVWQEPVDLEGAIASTPLLYNDHLYVGSYSHKMYKITLDGTVVAEYEGRNWIWGTPVILDDTLYYTDLSGLVYALNAEDLSEVWAVQAATRGIRPAPVVSEEYVVAASRDGRLYWLDRASGEVVFEREYEGTPELLSDLLLLEQDEEAGIPEDIVVVASVDTGRLVAAFTLDNSLPIWVYGR